MLALSGTETGYQGIHTRWTHCPNSNKAATEIRILIVVQLKFTSDTKMSRTIGRGLLTTLKISLSLNFPSNYLENYLKKTDSQLYKNYLCIPKNIL